MKLLLKLLLGLLNGTPEKIKKKNYFWNSILIFAFLKKALSNRESVSDKLLGEFFHNELSYQSHQAFLTKFEHKMEAFAKFPLEITLNLLQTNLNLQHKCVLKCLNSFEEFSKIGESNTHRDIIFPSYFCLFEKIATMPAHMQEGLVLKFRDYFSSLESRETIHDFLVETLKDAERFKSFTWLNEFYAKRLEWLEREIQRNSSGIMSWRMPVRLPNLPQQYFQFERFLRSDLESANLKNMFSTIAEARRFADKYAGNHGNYSTRIIATGAGKSALVTVLKTTDCMDNLAQIHKGYKKEYEIIRKQLKNVSKWIVYNICTVITLECILI